MKKLWILEDHEDFLAILEHLAESCGFTVQTSTTVKHAWDFLHEAEVSPGHIPVGVLSDFYLKDGNSEKWLMRMKELFPHVKVVCFSGFFDHSMMTRLAEHAIPAREKPKSLKEVVNILSSFEDH